MYARVTNIRFPPDMKAEVSRVVQGLAPILRWQRGFESLQVLTDPSTGGGIIVTMWETEADAETSEETPPISGR
jgi:heme-degrading monooxygenase HmoA